MDLSILISIIVSTAAFLLSAGSLIWVGGYKMSRLIHEVRTFKETMEKRFEKIDQRFDKLETKLEKMQEDHHKMDVRLTIAEQRKP